MSKNTGPSLLKVTSANEILKLVDLFPVAMVRANLCDKNELSSDSKNGSIKKKHLSVAEIVKAIDIRSVTNFVREHIGYCKQHIYLYDHLNSVPKSLDLDLDNSERVAEWDEDGKRKSLFFAKYNYTVVLKTSPITSVDIPFIWPFMVERDTAYLAIRIVIMEKSITSYINGQPYYKAEKSLSEEQILQSVIKAIGHETPIEVMDFNAGIKKLWDENYLDCRILRRKKAKSTSIELMDEDLTFKRQYPEEYQKTMQMPLFNCLFKTEEKAEVPGLHFTANPSFGKLAFTSFADAKGDIDYVIREVIRHNQSDISN